VSQSSHNSPDRAIPNALVRDSRFRTPPPEFSTGLTEGVQANRFDRIAKSRNIDIRNRFPLLNHRVLCILRKSRNRNFE
jgi:hypothetical protein